MALSRTRAWTLAGVCLLALSACGADPDADATAAATASATPTPPAPAATATSAASATAPPSAEPASPSASPTASADWGTLPCPPYDDGLDPTYVAVEPHRYASVCLGMSFADATDAIPRVTIQGDAQCPWYADIVAADPLFVAAVTSRDSPGDAIQMLRVSYLDDPATAPAPEMPRTGEGIAIGSTRAEVMAAYPTATAITAEGPARGPRDQVVAPQSHGLTYVFDITDGLVSEMTWGAGLRSGAAGEYCAG